MDTMGASCASLQYKLRQQGGVREQQAVSSRDDGKTEGRWSKEEQEEEQTRLAEVGGASQVKLQFAAAPAGAEQLFSTRALSLVSCSCTGRWRTEQEAGAVTCQSAARVKAE